MYGSDIPFSGDAEDIPPLVRQPKTRCAAIDAMTDAAYDAFESGQVVKAMQGFVLADLRGVRTYANEIIACVDKWNALGCPKQEDSIDENFTEQQYRFGWAAMLWFSQAMPEQAITLISEASRDGDRMARLFGFKFIGSRMYRPNDGWNDLHAFGIGAKTVAIFMCAVVALLGLLLAFVIYLGMSFSGSIRY